METRILITKVKELARDWFLDFTEVTSSGLILYCRIGQGSQCIGEGEF